jgi:uncharacterized protein YndB with AHSA1/START domain
MSDRADAVLQDRDGRTALRFERPLGYPPERVWRALTESEELLAWHPTPFELDPALGGTVRYIAAEGFPEFADGEVLEYDPPRLLAYTWGEDHLRWELSPREDGCLLILTHTFDDRLKAARDGAGWHFCLRWLARMLDGEETGRGEQAGGVPRGWRELNRAYEERFGIDPAHATPPPAG